MSHAQRLKVGALAVKNGNILAFGFNGTPSGFSNICEEMGYVANEGYKVVTKPEVIHAEANLITKAAKEGLSLHGSTVYITHAPCSNCALLLIQSGVKRVVYKEDYRLQVGINILKQANIEVNKQ